MDTILQLLFILAVGFIVITCPILCFISIFNQTLNFSDTWWMWIITIIEIVIVFIKNQEKQWISKKLICIMTSILVVIIVTINLYSAYKQNLEDKITYNNFITSIETFLSSDPKYYEGYSLSGEYDSELVINCNDTFDSLTKQQKFDYLDEKLRFCDFYDTYRGKMDYPITSGTLGKVSAKTSQNEYSLSCIRYFSVNGITDYETSRKNDNTPEAPESIGSHSLTEGMNGRYTYRCTKICSAECGNPCKDCIMNGKTFKRSPECNFDYGASNQIGWIGCPDCGDVLHSEWFDWYREKLGID